MWVGQSFFVLGVIILVWRACQPPDDNDNNDKGGGMLQPVYVSK